MRRLRAYLALIRWENALIAAAGVLLGAWWAGGNPLSGAPLFAAGAAIALAAYTYAHNDMTDLAIDLVAHPDRPLAAGRLGMRDARLVTRIAPVVAIPLAMAARPALGVLSIGVLLLMLAYDRDLKQRGLPGNLTVALLASLPFLYGAWSVGAPRQALPLLAVAVPLHMAREIAKDLDDATADAGVRRTLPVAFGETAARGALIVALLVFIVALVPLALARPEFAVLIVPSLALTVAAARRVLAGQRGGPFLFKSAMLCAMASLLAIHRG
jgi:4-hydroxybenzoate polyprenyltransferase